MLIRAARAEEAGALSELALRSKAYWGYSDAFIAACREELRLHPGDIERRRTTVAEREGRAIGFATLDGEPLEGELGMLFVDPLAIGQGVGRRLFDHTLDVARGLGFTRLILGADPNAEPFYRRMGAVRVGSEPSGSIPGRELPLMAVDLRV
ncbi:GNAT family N-acetyltransferase [Streptomyces johnsoniae]|uniref:GNAT family N-acetyltransferase n=1 Tax=Streptomyces johnsoniae TaxID=3075532 RepID=A0ABU2RWU5_9ACTN|nr:GNAT family N-acetyltransferase [Streptomyces sp. DSM 41886]MDT0441208.1 GNAT family N-acetyltransferase [Streptomyces sp. DSM 41886]